MALSNLQAAAIAEQLGGHNDYRVLRRLSASNEFVAPDGRPLQLGLIVDTETTGLEQERDKIIEIGLVLFEYDAASGQAFRVLNSYGALEDPGILLSAETTELTGITNQMVAGKKIDDDRVYELVNKVSLVIAHNAAFDRPFVERRFPIFENLPWGCSMAQIDWAFEGIGSRKLDYIAFRFGFFFDAHRAEMDCLALLNILQQDLPKSGEKALKPLIEKLSEKDWTVYALNSAFETKDLLKARTYRWDASRKTWHKTLTGTEAITNEVAWLKENIYNGRPVNLEFEVREALLRYSARPGKKVVKEV